MKKLLPWLCALALHGPATAQTSGSASPHAPARETPSRIAQSREHALAQAWGLREEEWSRYRDVMQGPLGIYSPNLDPLSALGVEARSEEERRRYAELQVQAESRRVEKLLAYQRAYDAAWQRLNPGQPRVNLPDAAPRAVPAGSGRLALFVRDDCTPCEQEIQKLQAAGTPFDLYFVGSRNDDARIRAFAQRSGVDAGKVRERVITLNHDGGRWLRLGLPGGLPATVRDVNGQWQRQP